jgi:hypothetical protein
MHRFSVRIIPARSLPSQSSDDKNSPWRTYERLLKFLPIISVCAFVLGFFKITGYYDSFNVNILNYISTSELLFSILPLCIYIVIILFMPMYFGMLQHNVPPLRLTQKWHIPSVVNPILMILLTIIFSLLGYLTPVHLNLYRNIPYFRVAAWYAPAIDIFLGYIQSKKESKLSPIDILIPFVLSGAALYCYGTYDATVVKIKGPNKCYTFKWKDKVIKSDSMLYIVGDVQGYLIFYRPKDSTTTIYKRSEIDSLVIRSLR